MKRKIDICRQCKQLVTTDGKYACQQYSEEHIWNVLIKYFMPKPVEEFENMPIPSACEMMFEYTMVKWNEEKN